MIGKLRQLAADPTLRHWLAARILGRASPPPAFRPHRPPYLYDVPSGARPAGAVTTRTFPKPLQPIELPLPGKTATVIPGAAAAFYSRAFRDTETLLAVHRFAWVPVLADAEPAWVVALWDAWRERFATPDESWAWHPYTAAERAVNLLGFFRRHGWPGSADETRALLAAHAPVVAARLEYFGERNTGNHLANNGRGLFVLGSELGMPGFADLGARILIEEARRIFAPSGILREGSSHYHLLYARNYVEAWLCARRHGHGAATSLEAIAKRAIAVIPRLCLKGGLPLIGDISPDCPPEHLAAFLPENSAKKGWAARLDTDELRAFISLRDSTAPVESDSLAADGWLRADFGDWSGLWHMAPGGWSTMPGHGHQDGGAFELHWHDTPLFVDLGRGAYGETGEAALYRSSRVHNGLAVDDADPYPPNKPYYDDVFRRREGGPPPSFVRDPAGVSLTFGGYARLGVPIVRRRWGFSRDHLTIADSVEGRGTHTVIRRLHTPWPCEIAGDAVLVRGPTGTFRVAAENTQPMLAATTRWTAYGVGTAAYAISFVNRARLGWSGALHVEHA